jgi:sugar fermentation stimulation protein A
MRFETPLIPATLLRRYKRFLADVVLPDGSETTVHVANPGSMLGLVTPGSRVFLSKSASTTRKLPYSWEMVEVDFGGGPELVGVNTGHPNRIVAEALAIGLLPEVRPYKTVRREVKYAKASRVDFLLEQEGLPPCYLEVKNVHMMRRPGLAEFPDCVTARAAKHMGDLGDEAERGARAMVLFLVQIGSAESLSLARDIDPGYGKAFDRALSRGVAAQALVCRVTPEEIAADRTIPVLG